MLSRQFRYNRRPALTRFIEKWTVVDHVNLAIFRQCPEGCNLYLGVPFLYKYVQTHRSRWADLGGSYFDLVLILTFILYFKFSAADF